MNGSYQFETLEGRHAEAAFLAERARMRLDGFLPLLARHGFPSRGRALELGCGQGLRARLMAETHPGVEVTGLDRSPELLAQARAAGPLPPNLAFAEGDLYELRLPERAYDFIYARLVFMHLRDPRAALARLRAALKPGGRLLIEDADRDCMFFEPAPASFAPFWRAVQEAQRRHGGDPNIGRKLAPLLKEAGYAGVKTDAQPITGTGDEIAFLARTLLPSLNLYLEPRERAAGEAAIADLARLARDPRATFYHFWFAVSATRPPTEVQ